MGTIKAEYPRGLTFEQVWAMFQETDQKFKETDQKIKETDRQMKETDRKLKESMQETDRKFNELMQKSIQEADRRFAKTEKFLESIGKQIGGLHNSFGELAEHLIAPGVVDRMNEHGYHFDIVHQRGLKIYDDKKNIKAEVDIYLENSDFIMAVEIKADPNNKDIEHHIRRLEILREYRNRHKDTRKIRGAIAAAIISTDLKQAMLDAGFYVLEQAGDTIKMDIPQDFVPRDW